MENLLKIALQSVANVVNLILVLIVIVLFYDMIDYFTLDDDEVTGSRIFRMVLCFLVLGLFMAFKNYHQNFIDQTAKAITNAEITLKDNIRISKTDKPQSNLDTSRKNQFTTHGWKKLEVN